LFCTYHRPAADEYPTTGLTGREGPHAVWEAICWPFSLKMRNEEF
jgi:hypothetical protein